MFAKSLQGVTVVRYSHFLRVYLSGGYIFQTLLSVPYRGHLTKKIPKFQGVYLIEGYFPKIFQICKNVVSSVITQFNCQWKSWRFFFWRENFCAWIGAELCITIDQHFFQANNRKTMSQNVGIPVSMPIPGIDSSASLDSENCARQSTIFNFHVDLKLCRWINMSSIRIKNSHKVHLMNPQFVWTYDSPELWFYRRFIGVFY